MRTPRPLLLNAAGLLVFGALLACGTALLTSGCGATNSVPSVAGSAAISRDEATPSPSPTAQEDIVIVEDPRVGGPGASTPSPSP